MAIIYINEWGNPVQVYSGTAQECQEYYGRHIERMEELDAWIDEELR